MKKPKKQERVIKVDRDGYVRCRVCRCTEREPCNPPCGWFDEDLCTSCQSTVESLTAWMDTANRANKAALWREAKRQYAEEALVG